MGRIGKEIIRRGAAFGMKCRAIDVRWDAEFANELSVERIDTLEDLFGVSDVISLNCNLDGSTERLVNKESIRNMKDGAIIINCARGEIVDSADVATALESGKLGGYGADVLDVEPPPKDHVLLSAPNCIITSHVGSRTFESVERQAVMATKNLIQFAAGEPPLAQANLAATKKKPPSTTDNSFYVIDPDAHNELVSAAYRHRGYSASESEAATRFCEMASRHGIRTHNAIKALHLDELFGSATGGCRPGAEIVKRRCRFEASEIWDARLKLGQSVAQEAMQRCMELADKYGIGQVSVDNTFHYLWGGGYVLDAAMKGYVAYTHCTSTLAEVVPYGGKSPTLGTNPHSWAFPTQESVGFPILIDWATSTIAMGRVQQFKREGRRLPQDSALDAEGKPTTDPEKSGVTRDLWGA